MQDLSIACKTKTTETICERPSKVIRTEIRTIVTYHKKGISEESVSLLWTNNCDDAYTFEIQILLYFDFYFHFCVFI